MRFRKRPLDGGRRGLERQGESLFISGNGFQITGLNLGSGIDLICICGAWK